jgi:hypothetical protein
MTKRQHSVLGTWIFGSVLLSFYFCVFVFAPPALPEFKQRMLGFVSALMAGLFGFFLTGAIGIEIKTADSRFGQLAVKASGGIALFVLTLWIWFGPRPLVATETMLKKTTEIEHYTKGGPYPQIEVELYFGPTNGMHKTIITSPPNPGFAMVLVENTNEFPIFDLSITMQDKSVQNGPTSQTMRIFNDTFKPMPNLLPNRPFYLLLPADPTSDHVDYTFYTQTRSGQFQQRFRFLVVGNRWEYARKIMDTKTNKVIATEVSANFPRNSNGMLDL